MLHKDYPKNEMINRRYAYDIPDYQPLIQCMSSNHATIDTTPVSIAPRYRYVVINIA